MRTVHKFRLQTMNAANQVDLPKGSNVIHVGIDGHGSLCIWAEVEINAIGATPTDQRHFVVVGTGWDISFNNAQHVGSTVTSAGFVWHVYELKGLVRHG